MVFWVFVCMSRILDMSLQAPQHDLKQQVHKSSSDYKLGGAIEKPLVSPAAEPEHRMVV